MITIWHAHPLDKCLLILAVKFYWQAIEKAIALWEPSNGFLRLCNEIDAKCPNTDELLQKVTLNNELAVLLSRDQPSPTVQIFEEGIPIENRDNTKSINATLPIIHTWTKVYRVVEQFTLKISELHLAIIADELNRSGRS
ncbi:hypothetical protein Mgra_00008445 [Meloidogyne graminicola]|uniref:Uncharacterized protein n=1 Tax=Meloidogyne graminicola TaxID=189291 RepID=A0A8S9ZFN8_9BILA|nr:hypothetical protein Mgra_00008445 [Meloidogyne graminicola]